MDENLKAYVDKERQDLFNMSDFSAEKRKHINKFLYGHGIDGKMLFLPIDQGLEHGPEDFFVNPDAVSPNFQLELARQGNYSGIVFQIGPARKHWLGKYEDVPLVLKLNGKTNIPPDKAPVQSLIATIEDAVEIGADAVGYTLYVGSPRQDEDFERFMNVRREAQKAGLPVIVWAYPRGEAVDASGGRDSLAMVDYAARVALEVGADIVKLNLPDPKPKGEYPKSFKSYSDLTDIDEKTALTKVVQSAGHIGVLVSGGSKLGYDDLLKKVRVCMEAGVDGLIFGRNMWQRKMNDAIFMTSAIKETIRMCKK